MAPMNKSTHAKVMTPDSIPRKLTFCSIRFGAIEKT